MNKVLYEPVGKIVSERKEFIDGNLDKADENNHRADELSNERDEKLADAKDDARSKYNESVEGFKEQSSEIVRQAQADNKAELNSAYENLRGLSNEAKEGLKDRMTELANDIVEKVLGYRSEVQNIDYDTVNDILYREGR